MSIRVLYGTEAFPHRNGGHSGSACEGSFASLDAAKSASFPEGHSFAFIPLDDGFWVYHSGKFGWECHAEK
jgi:hypothetical protein